MLNGYVYYSDTVYETITEVDLQGNNPRVIKTNVLVDKIVAFQPTDSKLMYLSHIVLLNQDHNRPYMCYVVTKGTLGRD